MNRPENKIKKLQKTFALFCTLYSLLLSVDTKAQDTIIIAGPQYGTSSFHQWKWGKHYRKEWITPVKVPLVKLDTLAGGLKPYEAGGGRQSKTLRLHDVNGREYVLRSIDKTYGKALPQIFQGTFVEKIINDQVSTAHPFAAVTIPQLADAAKIYHTWPRIFYVPQQAALDSFSNEFGNNLFLFEERPDGNWEKADNFGNTKKIISTEELFKELQSDQDVRVDQLMYTRSRLFDLFIGDWGRHEDQWRWAQFKDNDETLYRPIPRDRDQTYTKFDGRILNIMISAAGLGHLKSFDSTIKDVARFNFPARNLDRQLLNEVSLNDWLRIAAELQQALTDSLIETSVHQMPKEIFPISGDEIIAKLKGRRNKLAQFADAYYHFLAKEVEVVGSKKNELVVIDRINDSETAVQFFKINKEGEVKKQPYYARTFKTDETSEVRLYGLAGDDRYEIKGNGDNKTKVRIIGGIDTDSISNTASGKSKVVVYDNPDDVIQKGKGMKLRISADTAINRFAYNDFKFDKKGIRPVVFYNYADKVYAGLSYGWQKNGWRRTPFAHDHRFIARYSIMQNAPNFLYKGTVNQFIGNWSLKLDAHYDFVLWTNYFGLGNETPLLTRDVDFYRLRSRDGIANVGLERQTSHSTFLFKTSYQYVKLLNDTDRYVSKTHLPDAKQTFDAKQFAGGSFTYTYHNLNDEGVPTKGVNFQAGISYMQNIKESNRSVTRYTGDMDVYLPLLKRLVLAVHAGGATLNGEPEFYQNNSIGGRLNLRGFRRDRFWGKTTFYNSNELQYLFDVKTRLFNGKFGLLALYDQGRVWQPGESSDLWHSGVGGGILIAPFNKLAVSVSYAKSKEYGLIHLRFNMPID